MSRMIGVAFCRDPLSDVHDSSLSCARSEFSLKSSSIKISLEMITWPLFGSRLETNVEMIMCPHDDVR